MDNEEEIVLYYPYIDIDDECIIKTAALYWDGIQTIVPYDEYYKLGPKQASSLRLPRSGADDFTGT